MSKECTYITQYHFRPDNLRSSGLITCNMSYLLKSWTNTRKTIVLVHRRSWSIFI